MTPYDPATPARMVQHWEAVNRPAIRRDRWRDARGGALAVLVLIALIAAAVALASIAPATHAARCMLTGLGVA
jgi:hypothetical protein